MSPPKDPKEQYIRRDGTVKHPQHGHYRGKMPCTGAICEAYIMCCLTFFDKHTQEIPVPLLCATFMSDYSKIHIPSGISTKHGFYSFLICGWSGCSSLIHLQYIISVEHEPNHPPLHVPYPVAVRTAVCPGQLEGSDFGSMLDASWYKSWMLSDYELWPNKFRKSTSH